MPSRRVCCPDPLVSRLSGVTPPRLLKFGDVSWLTSPLKAKSPRKGETWPKLSRAPRQGCVILMTLRRIRGRGRGDPERLIAHQDMSL